MYSPPPQAEGSCQVARGEAGGRKDKLKLLHNSMSLPKQKNEGGPSYASPREHLLVEMPWSGPTRFPLWAKPCELPAHSLFPLKTALNSQDTLSELGSNRQPGLLLTKARKKTLEQKEAEG